SGRSRCWRNSPATIAPALRANDRSSCSDSSALNSGVLEALVVAGAEVSRAAWAPAVKEPLRAGALDRARLLYSIPTRNARSGTGPVAVRFPRRSPATLDSGPRNCETPYPSVPEAADAGCAWVSALTAGAAAMGDGLSAWLCELRPMATVEIACL